jgi:hypothetical protein
MEIAAAADRLLLKANARYRFPTAIDDLVQAAGLTEAKGSIFSDAELSQAPAHISTLMRRIAGKIQGLLDRRSREVHIHPRIQRDGHGRFVRLHEVSHDIFDWQRELAYADTELTLSPAIRAMFEREANQGGSELLFQRDVFRDVAAEYEIGIASVVELSEKFGASIRATLRRFAETHREPVAALVLNRQPISTSPIVFRRHEAVASTSWRERFGNPGRWPAELAAPDVDLVNIAATAGGRRRWGGRTFMPDLAGESVALMTDVLDNTYHLLVLAWIPTRKVRLIRRRRVLASAGSSPSSGATRPD